MSDWLGDTKRALWCGLIVILVRGVVFVSLSGRLPLVEAQRWPWQAGIVLVEPAQQLSAVFEVGCVPPLVILLVAYPGDLILQLVVIEGVRLVSL